MPVPRPVLVLLAALAGLAVGVLGTCAHRFVVGSGRWPVGLLLALALTASAGRLVHSLRPRAEAVLAMLLGWFVVYAVAAAPPPGGDQLIATNPGFPGGWLGLVWLPAGVGVLCAALLRPGRVRGSASGRARGARGATS